jgi:GGDEF domain-containing protein
LAPVRAFGVLPAILVNSPSMPPPTVGLTLTGELMTLAPVKVSGLVVLIGIHDLAGMRENEGHAAVEEMMHSVAKMVKSLMRSENDFMCKAKDDEFLLVLGDESGASAQRRLVAISEKLWDFQLRSLGTVFVLFNWASVEVQNEALADAFASAADRMHQTRRNRKTNSMDIAWMRRKAV